MLIGMIALFIIILASLWKVDLRKHVSFVS